MKSPRWLRDFRTGRELRNHAEKFDVTPVILPNTLLQGISNVPRMCLVWLANTDGRTEFCIKPRTLAQFMRDPDALLALADIASYYEPELADALRFRAEELQYPNLEEI